MFKNKCIKCGDSYDGQYENDEDYCSECRKAQIAIAKEIDAKVAIARVNRPPAIPPRVYAPIPGTDRVEINYRNL